MFEIFLIQIIEKILVKKVAKVKRMTNYNNLLFKTDNPIIKKFDFFKRFGTFYDLLINLLNKELNTLKATKEQNEIINKI